MIIKFRVVRKDTKAAIAGAVIVLEHGETDGITSAAGEAEIVTYYSGNLMFSVTATGYGGGLAHNNMQPYLGVNYIISI